MQTSEIVNRTRQNVEDINADVYTVAEVEDAMNDAKDQTVADVQIWDSRHLVTPETLVFAAGVREVQTFNGIYSIILHAESQSSNGSLRKHSVQPLAYRPEGFNDHTPYDLYHYLVHETGFGGFSQTCFIGRYNIEEAETITIFGFLNIGDLTSGSGSFTTAPVLFNNLIVIRATITLLSARQRNIRNWLDREQRMQIKLMELLKNKNKGEPRMVHYIDPDER